MARGPDDGINQLEEGKPAPGRAKAGKRDASRYDRDDDVESRPHRQGRGQPRQQARGRETIEEEEVESLRETDEPLEARNTDLPSRSRSQRRQAVRATDSDAVPQGRGSRFKYRSDDLRDRSARDTSDKKREQHRNANRLRYDEEEKRFEAEISEQVEAESEVPIEGLEEQAESEGPAPSEVKQRQRAQANAFREAKAKEEAAAETFEVLAEGETARMEGIASAKRKSRLNFSDEGSNFVHGAGRLAKRTVKTAAIPAMLYAGQQLREAGEENDGVRAVEASSLAARTRSDGR